MRILSAVTLAADPTVALAPGTKQYIDAGLAAKINSSLLGAASGVATLDGSSLVPVAQLPGATTSALGAVQLAGDLIGTAASPRFVSNATRAVTASYTVVTNDGVLIVTPSGSIPVITLPSAVTFANRRFTIKKAAGATAWPVQITASAGNVDGQSSIYIFTSGDYREFVSDGANWQIVGGTGYAVTNSPTSPANGGTLTVDASVANVFRVATSVAGWTLAVPTNGTDTQNINLEITPTVSFSLTLNASILLTTGITSPIAVTANKKLFLGLRLSGTSWYVLAMTAQS